MFSRVSPIGKHLFSLSFKLQILILQLQIGLLISNLKNKYRAFNFWSTRQTTDLCKNTRLRKKIIGKPPLNVIISKGGNGHVFHFMQHMKKNIKSLEKKQINKKQKKKRRDIKPELVSAAYCLVAFYFISIVGSMLGFSSSCGEYNIQ